MAARALLISSDTNTLAILRKVLSEMDIGVEECRDHSAAGKKISLEQYDVILVDSSNREWAEEVLSQARSSEANRNSLVINVTDSQASVRNTFAMGANLVLYRPVAYDRAKASLRAASHLIRRDKRRHPRSGVHSRAIISYSNVENASAILLDLSEEGLSIQCERELPTKSKIYFRFSLPGQMKVIQLSGQTVWQDSSGRAGIRFVDVPQAGRRLLKEWLNSRILVQESKVTVQMPVAKPGRLASSPPDRRIQSRHACQLGVEVYRAGTDIPHHCSLSDISVGGCYVTMPSPFCSGSAVEIVVRTSTFKFRSRGSVQVVHPGFGMGVAFAAQTDEQRQQVQELIKLVVRARQADGDPVLRF